MNIKTFEEFTAPVNEAVTDTSLNSLKETVNTAYVRAQSVEAHLRGSSTQAAALVGEARGLLSSASERLGYAQDELAEKERGKGKGLSVFEGRAGKDYMGDGVYASFDGHHVVLTAENGVSVTAGPIYLEPDVIEAVVAYARRCGVAVK